MRFKILTCIKIFTLKAQFCEFCEWIVFQKLKKQNKTQNMQNPEYTEKSGPQNQVYKKSVF